MNAALVLALAQVSGVADRVPCHDHPDRHATDSYVGRESAAYFRAGTVDRRQCDHFTRNLERLSEPVLRMSEADYSARFLWLRSFHQPHSFTLHLELGGTSWLEWRTLDADDHTAPDADLVTGGRTLSEQEADAIAEALIQAAPCDAHPDSRVIFDGSHWILEIVDQGGGYCFKQVRSPEAGAFRTLGADLITLAGLELPDDEIY